MLDGFSDDLIPVSAEITLRVRQAGVGPPVLLLHGYPQTHLCWHKVAPLLVAAGFRVVLSDLRGYGASSKPAAEPDHASYSKRAMAADQVALMRALGHERFCIAGHDRGGRVAHRMGLDHPDAVRRMSVLDIAPTATMYARTDRDFATAYYHWFFLIQPAPLPELMLGADPDFFIRRKIMGLSQGAAAAFPEAAMDAYCSAFRDPACIAATCEDYRAAATIDLEHDAADADARLAMPLLVLWGANGVVARHYDVVETWREKSAGEVHGWALPCGHFLPEEQPDATAEALIDFFGAD